MARVIQRLCCFYHNYVYSGSSLIFVLRNVRFWLQPAAVVRVSFANIVLAILWRVSFSNVGQAVSNTLGK